MIKELIIAALLVALIYLYYQKRQLPNRTPVYADDDLVLQQKQQIQAYQTQINILTEQYQTTLNNITQTRRLLTELDQQSDKFFLDKKEIRRLVAALSDLFSS